jgi:hypothetical protein
MRLDRAAGFCLLGSSLLASPAPALQFEQVPVSATEVVLGGRGPIVKGDTTRLEQALAALPRTRQLLGLALDSPGGTVTEGESLARLVRTRKLTVVIPSNSKCVSACFLLLAASPKRLAAADALVGVHSASESGEETLTALAMTTRMAQDAAAMDIPLALIGKMVQAVPPRVEWLTHADLSSMDVSVFEDDMPAALRRANTTGVRRADPDPPPAQAQSQPPSLAQPPSQPQSQAPPQTAALPDFTAGSEDRHGWDTWLASLHGPYRDGAAFAQAQVGLPQSGQSESGPCQGGSEIARGDFTSGCEDARQRLAPVDNKVRSNTDYAAGWNSAGQSIAVDGPMEAEYQGAFFCGRQVARLTLKVLSRSESASRGLALPDQPQRRAVVSFGPQPTSPDVPRGAFIVEGAIDLQGGAITVSPVRWVSQPAGYPWLGLSGSSDDGGKTFGGRTTDNSACTIFTLKRIDAATVAR